MTGDPDKNFQSDSGDSVSAPISQSQEDTTVIIHSDNSQTIISDARGSTRAIGSVIGKHYRLESRIGSGGSSIVYLAHDLLLVRKVALKLLLSGAFTSDEDRLRFEREGRSVGSLDHPHIVRVFEFNTTENDEPFLVMEYLDGQSLSDIIHTEGKLSVERSLFFGRQVVSALHYAHSRGLIHRDIKSSNIVITHDSNGQQVAKVVDFGLARPDDEAVRSLTITGTIVGSPHYMSPEQCKGDKVDARSDIYSLGCVLYECLTGTVPFSGASMLETFRMHLEDQPKPFSRNLKAVKNAAQIEAVIFKCLAKKPEDRYQSTEKLEEDIKALEQNSRSSALAEASTLFRSVRATSSKSAKTRKRLIFVGLVLLIGSGFLLAKPELISYPCDEYWSKLDFTAQEFFDKGDFVKAKEEFEKANKFAKFAPVSKPFTRVREGYFGLSDLARVEIDDAAVKTYTEEIQNLIETSPAKENLRREDPKILSASFRRQTIELQKEKDVKKRQADAIRLLDSANDAADVMIEEERRYDAAKYLEFVFDGTRTYIPEANPVIGRTLLNVANIFANIDPLKSFQNLEESGKLMETADWPPLPKAHFLTDYGLALLLTEQTKTPEIPLNDAIEIYRYQNSLTGKAAATTFLRLAQAQVRNGKPILAATSLEQAESIFKSSEKVTSGEKLRCATTRAEILVATGKFAEGNALVEKELLRLEKQFPKNYTDLSEALEACAKLISQGKGNDDTFTKVNLRMARCCAILERTQQWMRAGSLWRWLGTYQGGNRRLVDAEKSYRKAWACIKHMRSPDYFTEIALLNNLGEILIRRQQYKEADRVLAICEKVMERAPYVTPPTKQYLYQRRREAAQKLGDMQTYNKYNELIESNF